MLAPVVLFTYNRPRHTAQVLQALSENLLADKTPLIVYCDGPSSYASKGTIRRIKEVRDLVKSRTWCKSVDVIERETNFGLAENIFQGVTEVINQYDKVIVLEDDIITSPGFLTYMNEALDFYQSQENVMHISGYMFPVSQPLPPTFFYNTASCWGWATWKRAWNKLRRNSHELIREIEADKGFETFNVENTYQFERQLRDNANGNLKTWAIKWYATIFLNDGLCLHPYPSLTKNVGNDGSGINSKKTNKYHWETLADSIKVETIDLKESTNARKLMQEFNRGLKEKKLFPRSRNLIRIVKSLTPPILYQLLRKSSSSTESQLDDIRSMPRYQNGTIKLFDRELRFADGPSFYFMYDEIFKKEIYKFYTPNGTPLILDGGANIGLSIIYFKKLYPNARIVGFEPDPKIFRILEANVNTFSPENVELVNKGLWDSETTLQFYSEGADGGRKADDGEHTISIETTVLKDHFEEEVDFLKLDIEGAEYTVLKSSQDLLSNVNNIFIEYHSFVGQEQFLPEILAILKDSGFRIHLNAPGLTSKNPFVKVKKQFGMDLQVNLYGYRG